MATVTVKDIIKAELLRVCKEATEKHRVKQEKREKKEKFSETKIQKVREWFSGLGWDQTGINKMMEAMAILHDAPELKAKGMIPADVFTVIVPDKNAGNHNYAVGSPHIVTNVNGGGTNTLGLFHADGRFHPSWVQVKDEPRYATDDEVEQCINELTPTQWEQMRLAAMFKPISDAALTREVSVPDTQESDDKPNGELQEGDEVSLPDGRKITVGD